MTLPSSAARAGRIGLLAAAASLALTACAEPRLRPARAERAALPAATFQTPGLIARPGRCGAQDAVQGEKGLGFDESVLGHFASPVAGIVADFVTGSITAALKYRQKARSALWHASTTLPFDAGELTGAEAICLHLFRGEVSDARVPRWSGEPVFDGEFELEWHEVDGALMLAARPTRVSFADTSAADRGSGRKDVSVMFAFSKAILPHGVVSGDTDATPGAAEADPVDTGRSVALLRVDLGQLEIGRSYDKRLLALTSGGAILPDDDFRRHRPEQPTAMADLLDGMTLTGIVFESDGPNPALDAFLAAWSKHESAVSGALAQTVEEAAKKPKKQE